MQAAGPSPVRMTAWSAVAVAAVLAAAAGYAAHSMKARPVPAATPAPKDPHPPLPGGATTTNTAHYRIHSTATDAQTAQVASAVESLYARYVTLFPPPPGRDAQMTLVLYRDRAEFKRNNRSRPWAEAYYLPPRSYAYFDAQARNPYHWMLHEATHQLMREVSAFPRVKWMDEGVASYFGASRLANGRLRLGEPDADAYPIWWLRSHVLTGDLAQDIAAGQVIPLEQLISGRGGPDENRYFNLYYIHYWSLTHFLLHYRGGVYSAGYRQLLAEGGTRENFERRVGPIERIQGEWYGHLLQQVGSAGGADVGP